MKNNHDIFNDLNDIKLITRDSLNDKQFNEMMKAGYHQTKLNDGLPIDEAFNKIKEDIFKNK